MEMSKMTTQIRESSSEDLITEKLIFPRLNVHDLTLILVQFFFPMKKVLVVKFGWIKISLFEEKEVLIDLFAFLVVFRIPKHVSAPYS
jgi:hypothetical protein